MRMHVPCVRDVMASRASGLCVRRLTLEDGSTVIASLIPRSRRHAFFRTAPRRSASPYTSYVVEDQSGARRRLRVWLR